MGIDEKQDSLDSLIREVNDLKNKISINEEEVIKLRTEVKELESNDNLDKAIEELPVEKLKQ